jgi:hypothetical protein
LSAGPAPAPPGIAAARALAQPTRPRIADQGAFLAVGAGADAIAESFARLGFAPRETGSADDRAHGRLGMRLEHCPFRDAVMAPGGELVCRLHRGLAEGIVVAAGGRLTAFRPQDPVRAGCGVEVDGLGDRGDRRAASSTATPPPSGAAALRGGAAGDQ